jgi:hypothetical protein
MAVIGHRVKNRHRRLSSSVSQADGVIHHRLHALFRLLRGSVVVHVEHIEEEKSGFADVEMVDVHAFSSPFVVAFLKDGQACWNLIARAAGCG